MDGRLTGLIVPLMRNLQDLRIDGIARHSL
jgi:hypothetical protein